MSSTPTETFAFQAEINQLLSLIINTFYSNKDIFLRELISNANDAIEKVRYLSLTDDSISNTNLEIQLVANKDEKTLTIKDNGVGMSKDELVKNLGTIAHSGTRAFAEAMGGGNKTASSNATAGDANLVGQYGVGFFSAYLVAKSVKVISRKANEDDTYIWESTAGGSFTIAKSDGTTDTPALSSRGTEIILYLKDDCVDYLEEQKIVEVVKKHNQYCPFPIKLYVEREEDVIPETKEEVEIKPVVVSSSEIEEGDVEDVPIEPSPPQKIKVNKWEIVNKQAPIWTRKPEDVTFEEYNSFYKSMTGNWEDHLYVKHFSLDGQIQFKALLFIPKQAPYDMFQGKKVSKVKLYVKKVLIFDETEDLLPEYLHFIHGIVDSDDLPLNVSREMLQQNSIMKVIQKNLVKRCIDMMNELAKDEEKWPTFYDSFSNNIKLGIHEDSKNRDKLIELLRFSSSKVSEKTSFKDYVSRMKEDQTKIYYITSESLKGAQSSPFIEILKKRNLEVLYMVDPIDEYMVQNVKDYADKTLMCCSKDGFELELTEDEKRDKESIEKEWETVCSSIKTILTPRIANVKVSERLSTNPCVLVSDKYGWTPQMEKLMRSQTLANPMTKQMIGNNSFSSRRILEVNPAHAIMKEIKACIENKKDIKNIVEMLFETVLLDSGFTLDEPSKYAQNIYKLIASGLSCATDEVTTLEIDANNGGSVEEEVGDPSMEEVD